MHPEALRAGRMPLTARAVGLLLGYAADTLFGDPRRWHPVAGFGQVARASERAVYADSRPRGVAHVLLLTGGAVGAGWIAERAVRRSAVGQVVVGAATAWTVLGGRSLVAEAGAMHTLLAADDLPAARHRLSHLCSRDASGLDGDDLARATVESVAENTSDAVVAPLFWGAVAGVPGLLGYRAVNTLDAMVGYRTPRYLRFGWGAARLDDLANWAPARVSAALSVLAAPVVGGLPWHAWRVWRRDGTAHPSPNAGHVEAAFAGALGVTLGGSNVYAGEREDRGVMGAGRRPQVADLPRVARLSRTVSLASVVLAGCSVTVVHLLGRRTGSRRG